MKKFALILSVVLMCACAAQKPPYIPTEPQHNSTQKEYKTDTIYRDRFHTEYMKGDTMYIHDSIFLYKTKHDSVLLTDTITQPPVFIEKELTKKQNFLIKSGVALWILLGLLILSVIIGIVIKFVK